MEKLHDSTLIGYHVAFFASLSNDVGENFPHQRNIMQLFFQ